MYIICSFFFQIFEREVRREKILEAKQRELKLKMKQQGVSAVGGGGNRLAGFNILLSEN